MHSIHSEKSPLAGELLVGKFGETLGSPERLRKASGTARAEQNSEVVDLR